MANPYNIHVGDFVDWSGQIWIVEDIPSPGEGFVMAECSNLINKGEKKKLFLRQLMRLTKENVQYQLNEELEQAKKKIERIKHLKATFDL